ncbi:nicotinate (nicotinamide) nucleotide adenylyltransferase [Desulfocurvus sp. DL9XJH121]
MKVGILGGCFNPLHVGHLRLALETREDLGLDRVELMPAATPPHKPGEPMLPFALRADLCEAAIRGLDSLAVNRMEAERPGPSYTVDTLRGLADRHPDWELAFILGAEDLRALPGWKRGLEIPGLADLAVAARGRDGLAEVRALVADLWPGASARGDAAWDLPGGGRVRWVRARRMDVSSSDVRERWLSGRTLRGLVPECVERMLGEHALEARAAWGA